MASATMRDDRDRLATGRALAFDAREVEQVLDDAIDAERLGVDALGESLRDGGVALELQGLGEQSERPHGRLQLVTDVGDEVAANVFEAPALGDVFDDGEHAERATPVVDDRRRGW